MNTKSIRLKVVEISIIKGRGNISWEWTSHAPTVKFVRGMSTYLSDSHYYHPTPSSLKRVMTLLIQENK